MLLKFSKILIHVSLFSVVIVMTSTFFPFIGGKDYFFRFAVELALIFFILWWAFESGDGETWARIKEVSGKPLFIAVSAFVLAVLLATIFAHDMHAAFWSNYERGEGSFQMLHYYVFFALLVILFEKKEDWRRFFKTFLAAGAFMILYGVFADLGWAADFVSKWQGGDRPDGWWQRLIGTRFQGSLGNPAYVAPYLLFSMFYASYLWVTSKIQKKRIAAVVYGLPILLLLFFFMVTWTRGAFLGLGAAIYVALIFLGFTERKYRSISLGAIAAIFFVGGIFVHYRNNGFVQALPGGRMFDIPLGDHLLVIAGMAALAIAALTIFAREKRYLWWVLGAFVVVAASVGIYSYNAHYFTLADPTTSTRFWTWGSAWQGFKERPIFGWGPENFTAVFDKYFDPRHFVPGSTSETWFDRAHSIYFDYLAETGLLGLLSFLGIFAALYNGLLRKKRSEGKSIFTTEKTLMIALPVVYLVQGVAIFDVLPIYINLFAFFAFGYFFLYSAPEQGAAHHNK